MVNMMQQMNLMYQQHERMMANNTSAGVVPLGGDTSLLARGFETQSAGDGNHNFSQLLTNLSNMDKSKGSHNSSGGTNN